MHKTAVLGVAILTSFAAALPINAALGQDARKKDWITTAFRGSNGSAELQKVAAWVNEKCGPADPSGIQGFVSETNQSGNWDVHIFCRIEAPGSTSWKNGVRGGAEPANIKDMAAAIQLGRLVIVGNVKGDADTTIIVLEK